ncbi:copper chaperone PCu(A)C [Streptomyces sp. NBC_01294]|uniref:copper chaperone PCu(A)C n=1 Tax=Streptomyces sp. NBC_01294 TaxID=2903815 RepID=UPI002DDC726E|nr:copper chaperone PCu(A)C [Streptomyces sp. NBC_01294]WRZ58369.1 copper chaperone PCu(A)C [Streptomyces sp. NBC_01294]
MNARTTRTLAAALSLTAALAISGCSGDDKPEMTVSGAFMPQPVNGKAAGGFMVIKNASGTADKLTGATSPLSDDLEIHETKDQKMQQVQSMDVPANGELKLERGGNHIMFMGLKSAPQVGDKVTVELRFEKAGSVKVELDVKDRTYSAQAPTSTAGHAH